MRQAKRGTVSKRGAVRGNGGFDAHFEYGNGHKGKTTKKNADAGDRRRRTVAPLPYIKDPTDCNYLNSRTAVTIVVRPCTP